MKQQFSPAQVWIALMDCSILHFASQIAKDFAPQYTHISKYHQKGLWMQKSERCEARGLLTQLDSLMLCLGIAPVHKASCKQEGLLSPTAPNLHARSVLKYPIVISLSEHIYWFFFLWVKTNFHRGALVSRTLSTLWVILLYFLEGVL